MKPLKLHLNLPISKSPNRPIAKSSNRPIISCSPLLLLSLSLCLLTSTALFAQREADNWIFGDWAGLNFTSGDPVPIFHDPNSGGFFGTVMSDSTGNLLFYSDGETVWNRNDNIMINGSGLLPGHNGAIQNTITFPKPGSKTQYYLFSVTHQYWPEGLYYSVIDMTLDGGLGGVTSEKNIKLEAAAKAASQVFALKNDIGDGYWVISRLYDDDRYVCFKVDETGVHPDPVYSSPGLYREPSSADGRLRVSPDKKYLIASYLDNDRTIPLNGLEVCTFNKSTGFIDFQYIISRPDSLGGYCGPWDWEFSPDSKFLYVTYNIIISSWSGWALCQYNMHFIEDSAAFYNSLIKVRDISGHSLQLSNDGRIYTSCLADTCKPTLSKFISVINKPWEQGVACDFDTCSIYLGGRDNGWHTINFLLDFLYRFEWEADDYCQGSAVHFLPHFVPTPDSVKWSFGEFAIGSSSTELSPTYTFKYPGIHDVAVDIWYPTGRFEHTSREIEIFPTPHPDLGPDLLICEGTSDTLYANCDADFYSWNGILGTSQYIVSDSGFYRVTASYLQTGCSGSDTIHVGFYPPVTINESSLVITPTTCNGASGSITGLIALGSTPFAYLWEDLSGNDYGTSLDLFNLPAGQYILTVIDGNSCQTSTSPYTIDDAGNLSVTQVQVDLPHCFRPDGQIIITAFSPLGSSLQYSIDDGVTYQADSVFTWLIAASYVVRVTDGNGCFGFYIDNPVVLEDIPGPQVMPPVVTDETDFLGNGSIEITATGSTTSLYYSNDNGNTYQSNNGTFDNLAAGTYICIVKDENDCDTTFTVEIQNIILTYLQAIADSGNHCHGDAVTIHIEVENFNSVATFRLKLSFNADNLQCNGYTHVNPQLQNNLNGWVDQASGEITFQWQDTVAITLNQPDTVAELVFITKQPGLGDIAWYTGTTESYFTNLQGSAIPAEFHTGEVNIYEPPSILLSASKSVCEGQSLSLMSIATGNHPPFNYQWTYPSGLVTGNDPFFFSITQADAGDYTLLVTDVMHCTDQKVIHIEVSENPVAAFHGTDTLEMHSGDVLDAGTGLSSYSWNTGDTTESIVILAEGKYSVEMESPAGCTGSDSVYVKLATEEIPETNLFIPNAFTPDEDGVNDTFQAFYNGNDMSDFSMEVYDRWGGRIFRSDDIYTGWDGTKNGKPCPGGVYVYKVIITVDGTPGKQERVGMVALVK
jgi:gliding motility-associated-like protein